MLGVLPYTPGEVAVPADATSDASSVYLCLALLFCFARPSMLFGAYEILEIGQPNTIEILLLGHSGREKRCRHCQLPAR